MALAFGGSEVGYQFAWSTGDSTATITNLPLDIFYTVVVTDAYGCTTSAKGEFPSTLIVVILANIKNFSLAL